MNAHRIRLRRPWRREPSAEGLVWRRRFNRPTGLGPGERVWIVVEGIAAEGSVSLNGRILGPLSPDGLECRFEVTERLPLHNELAVRLGTPSGKTESLPDSPPGEVAIEITAVS